ncbi:MAG TPA: diguanylate cyclase [Terriglobales bacterium]|nr:diguanylate cyclase [Terriglobales bacterium]
MALLLLVVFTFLYRQSRDAYFRHWQLAWVAYCLHFIFLAVYFTLEPSPYLRWGWTFTLGLTAWGIFRSTRVVRHDTRFRWSDAALVAAAAVWSTLEAFLPRLLQLRAEGALRVRIELGIAAVLAVAAFRFYRHGQRRGSIGHRLLGIALAFWALLLTSVLYHDTMERWLGGMGHVLGPVPQTLLAIAMVIVLFENERRSVQDNLLAFSSLEADSSKILPPGEVAPNLERLLERLMRLLGTQRAAMVIAEEWRSILPSVQRGFSPEFVKQVESDGSAEFLSETAYRRGGLAVFRDFEEPAPSLQEQTACYERMRRLMEQEGARGVTAVSLQTRERCFGAVLFPSSESLEFGPSQIRLMLGLAMQIGLTLENYALMHDALRRTKEYELLTQIGQVISSRLDPDEVLVAIQRELGQLFDTSNFYVAFLEEQIVRFELEVLDGVVQPKRTRPITNGLTEYVIRTGQPLLIKSDMEKTRARLNCAVTGRPAKCFCAVPIVMHGETLSGAGGGIVGVIGALNYEREFVYSERDLEVMTTAAGQVAVAMENARLFSEEQRRARYLAFLNNVSKTAISSQDAEQMLAEIVGEIQKNFRFDHIGIGILDYATKDIEIKAEAGTTARALGKRVPLGAGILGRVARTNEMALAQNSGDERLASLLDDAKSVLCIPIGYGESLLGVLNVESRREDAFGQQEVLILRTLADLLATALHNAFVFQKLQQQSITDGLTGIKTRRFFLESLQSEWKRASRSGRAFSVVLADLDKFKEVNDSQGHLEGDLVLARVGRLLEQNCRQSNVVARYGGDEFVILMPETGLEQAQVLSERLRLWLATDPMLNERHITGSFGVASFPLHGATAEEILRVADAGMYVSKHGGGNRVSTVEQLVDSGGGHRQLVSAFVEGFLQREHTGPEQIDELVQLLRKLAANAKPEYADEVLAEAVLSLARASETREMFAAGHGEAVARYSELLGRALDLTQEEMKDLVFAARVHDVGKLLIPERILNKNAPLTPEEYYLVKIHSTLGAQIVSVIPGSARMQQIVRHHHERFDGTGYPSELRGENIPLGARIVAAAEAYAHMIAERSYAPTLGHAEALAELEKASGTQLDGMLVRTLVRELKSEKAARQGY